MARKKQLSQEEIYLNQVPDEAIRYFAGVDIRSKFPNSKLIKWDKDFSTVRNKNPQLALVKISEVERKGEKASVKVNIFERYTEQKSGKPVKKFRLLFIDYDFNAYDCQNSKDGPRRDCANEQWIGFVDDILEDEEYRPKAYDYAKKKFYNRPKHPGNQGLMESLI